MERPIKILDYRNGCYWLEVLYFKDHAQVGMKDYSQRLPILWSVTTTKAAAAGTIELFKTIGYFDAPVKTN